MIESSRNFFTGSDVVEIREGVPYEVIGIIWSTYPLYN